MTSPSAELRSIKPTRHQRVMDLARKAGIDTSDWANYDGEHASANPKYCYDWAFVREGKVVVLNIWHSHLKVRGGKIVADLTIHADGDRAGKTVWTGRERKFSAALRAAWEDDLEIRVILLDGGRRHGRSADDTASQVKWRELDTATWAVTRYDARARSVTITRNAVPTRKGRIADIDPAADGGYADELSDEREYREGARKRVWVNAIERDREARRACLRYHGHRCAACDMLFGERYGKIGENYIHVHHVRPLSASSGERKVDPARDLVPICPNCHAMLHRDRRPMTVKALRRKIAQARAPRS